MWGTSRVTNPVSSFLLMPRFLLVFPNVPALCPLPGLRSRLAHAQRQLHPPPLCHFNPAKTRDTKRPCLISASLHSASVVRCLRSRIASRNAPVSPASLTACSRSRQPVLVLFFPASLSSAFAEIP